MYEKPRQLKQTSFRITLPKTLLCANPYRSAQRPLVATRTVRRGNPMSRLAVRAWGFPSGDVFRRVAGQDPRISDVHWTQAGPIIRLPGTSDLQARTLVATSPGQQRP